MHKITYVDACTFILLLLSWKISAWNLNRPLRNSYGTEIATLDGIGMRVAITLSPVPFKCFRHGNDPESSSFDGTIYDSRRFREVGQFRLSAIEWAALVRSSDNSFTSGVYCRRSRSPFANNRIADTIESD